MAIPILIALAVGFLAYANGANDNFKGVATLFGSRTTDYRVALAWATLTTFAGSLASLILAESLVTRFSGRGLISDGVAVSPPFLLAVTLGAGLTVILATVLGSPISTTHGLTGALLGSGLAAVGTEVNVGLLGNAFFLPLLVSPVLAVSLSCGSHVLFRFIGGRLGVTPDSCICIGEGVEAIPMLQPDAILSVRSVPGFRVRVDTLGNCVPGLRGELAGVHFQKCLDGAHFVSAGVVSFARGLNDTPKIVALLLVAKVVGIELGILAVALGMAAGGILNAKKVAETLSERITPLTPAQGLTANLVTGALVVFASRLGLPVSTTHVSVGALFGVGLVRGEANLRVVTQILWSWVLTLPVAAVLSAGIYWIVNG